MSITTVTTARCDCCGNTSFSNETNDHRLLASMMLAVGWRFAIIGPNNTIVHFCPLCVLIGYFDKLQHHEVRLYATDEKENMLMIKSSIIAIKNPLGLIPLYLQYWDEQWQCWFFPNYLTKANVDEDKHHILDQLSSYLDIYIHPELTLVSCHMSEKPSTEHEGQIRRYEYRLYACTLRDALYLCKKGSEEFTIGSRRYRWMSLQDLQSDATASTIHADVITMIKNAEKRLEQL